jgi:hypothetical protein
VLALFIPAEFINAELHNTAEIHNNTAEIINTELLNSAEFHIPAEINAKSHTNPAQNPNLPAETQLKLN